MRNQKKGKLVFAALKLDISKAHDRVKWRFLEAIMDRMAFDRSWIRKVLSCLSSFSYSFALNRDVVGSLIPTRGIRQGDPLSLYLFAICVQGLSSMISSYASNGLLKGIKLSSCFPMLTHLFSQMIASYFSGLQWIIVIR